MIDGKYRSKILKSELNKIEDTDSMKNALKELGVSLYNEDSTIKTLIEILDELSELWNGEIYHE